MAFDITLRDNGSGSFDISLASGITIATGLATETDTAFTIGKVKAYSPSLETDSAPVLVTFHVYPTGIATETDSAQQPAIAIQAAFTLPFGFRWGSRVPAVLTIGIGNETDSSLQLGRVKLRAAGLASETDSSLNLSRVKIRAAGTSLETDSAQPLSRSKLRTAGVSLETDSASVLGHIKLRSTGVALETDTAFALDIPLGFGTGVAAETDSALHLARTKFYATRVSLETDSSVTLTHVKVRPAGNSLETDSALQPYVGNVGANPPAFYFPLRFNIGAIFVQPPVQYAIEIDTALALVRTKFYSVQLASETDVALNLGTGDPGFWLPLRFYIGVPGGAKLVNTGRAEESDTALSRTLVRSPQKTMVRWAQETAVVSSVTYRRIRAVLAATSTNTALVRAVARTLPYGIASESDTAFGPPLGIVGQIGVATEVDSAFRLNRIQAVTVKVANESDNALALIAPDTVDVGVAVEVDSALTLETSFVRGINPALELDEALPRQILHTISVQTASSTNEAIRLARIRVSGVGLSQSFNTAFSITKVKRRVTGTAVEVDAARGMLVRSYAAREYDNALFFEIKKNGVVVYPVVSTSTDRRMWSGFIS